jgi:hypothetical protein
MAGSAADGATRPSSVSVALISLVLVALIAGAVFIPTAWLRQVQALEQQWILSHLGENTARAILHQAARWFDAQVAASGRGDRALQEALSWTLLEGSDPAWLTDRLEAAWLLVELALLRAALLAAWAPAMGLLLMAGVLDGHWRWRIRQLGFDYPSPSARQAGQLGLRLVVGLLLFMVLLPVPLHPFVVPLLGLPAVLFIGTSLAHRPKQL